MSGSQIISPDVEPFKLKSSSGSFAEKLSNVFGSLNALEKQHEEWKVKEGEETAESSLLKADPEDQDDLRMTDSFKKPQMQPPRKRHHQNSVPDFQKHPEKWTKYTLRDVPGKDLSSTANTEACMSFLAEMKQRTANDYATTQDDNEGDTPTFKPVLFGIRNQNMRKMETDNADSSAEAKHTLHHGSKFVMPECVVGMSKPLKKSAFSVIKRAESKPADKSIHLDHLNEDDDDDDDDNKDDEMHAENDNASPSSLHEDSARLAKSKIRALRQNRCDDD